MLKNKFPIFSFYFSERQKCFLIPSALFAGFALLYRPLKLEESLCPLYESGSQIAKTLFLFTIYTILFYYAITFLYNYLNRLNPEERAGRFSYPQKAALLGLIWLPHIIAAYPASIPPDTETQLIQFMGYEPFTAHHPPVHTCLIGICTQLGGWLFHSYNIGLFFALILQYIAMLLIFTYTIHYLEKRKAPVFILRFQWAVYSLIVTSADFAVIQNLVNRFFFLFRQFVRMLADSPCSLLEWERQSFPDTPRRYAVSECQAVENQKRYGGRKNLHITAKSADVTIIKYATLSKPLTGRKHLGKICLTISKSGQNNPYAKMHTGHY